jgi:hypothetical protein
VWRRRPKRQGNCSPTNGRKTNSNRRKTKFETVQHGPLLCEGLRFFDPTSEIVFGKNPGPEGQKKYSGLGIDQVRLPKQTGRKMLG